MSRFSSNQRGMVAIVCAMACFVSNDTAMKLTGSALPLSEAIFLRSLFASFFCLAVILARGQIPTLRHVGQRLVLVRGCTEIIGTFSFLAALRLMPISDVTAIEQIVPLLLTAYAALVLRETVAPVRLLAITIGFAGALMIAAPSGQISTGAWLAFGTALAVAARDLLGRRMHNSVSPLAVTLAGMMIVGIAAFAVSFIPGVEPRWIIPSPAILGLLLGSSILLSFAYVTMIMALRLGQVQALAPLYYSQTLFALFASLFVFGDHFSAQALLGTALVVAAGLFVIAPLRGATPPAVPVRHE